MQPARLKCLTLKNTCFLISLVLLSSCSVFTYPKKNQYSKTQPFLFDTPLPEIKGGNFSKDERTNLQLRLYTQLDDSSKVIKTDKFFIFHPISNPPVYDSSYSIRSTKNMKAAMLHLGYYNAKVSYTDTVIRYSNTQQRVYVKYVVDAGNPTLIDTFSYKLRVPELQRLADSSKEKSLIKKGNPVAKTDVLGEISRLVELYRNNGYYKFTPDELRMRGDTTIAALTSVSDDPFETLRLLEEANRKRDSPTIKLAMVINPASDSNRLIKYYVNNIYLYPDYTGDDSTAVYKTDTLYRKQDSLHRYPFLLTYHSRIVRNSFLFNQLLFKKGDLYNLDYFNKTVNNFSRTGVWQNINVLMLEKKDSIGKLDMYVQLAPAKKYGFEGKVEASYSSNSNTNNINVAGAGNLLGLSGNVSLQSRNVHREGIKVTHSLRAGIELNLNTRANSANFINSSDFGYNLTVAIPKLVIPNNLRDYLNKDKKLDKLSSKQSFISLGASNTNRIGLFKLNSFSLAAGYEWAPKPNLTWNLKIVNVEFSDLYNKSAEFEQTLNDNPFLRYSFNTALVLGSSASVLWTHFYPRHPNRALTLRVNLEESGWFLGILPMKDFGSINKDLKNFAKIDAEAVYNIKKARSEIAYRGFVGIGVPIGSSDPTLPFFKQYYGGGPNSMRGWPIRGIGPGAKALPSYEQRTFADRTGDIRFEINAEYRKSLFQIIPNTLTLKWALFADVGNVWNLKNTMPGGAYDSAQFHFKNFYHDLGADAGTGFRFDFNYVTLRFDFGFRIKRPELSENGGWKLPSIGFDDLFGKLFKRGENDAYRRWRYENFNFTIGLNYPF